MIDKKSKGVSGFRNLPNYAHICFQWVIRHTFLQKLQILVQMICSNCWCWIGKQMYLWITQINQNKNDLCKDTIGLNVTKHKQHFVQYWQSGIINEGHNSRQALSPSKQKQNEFWSLTSCANSLYWFLVGWDGYCFCVIFQSNNNAHIFV